MIDVVIVGTGFAGIGMAIALRRAGMDSFVVLERADEVGGTWRDNRYPGCACDIPSMLYSFSFERKHDWTRAFPPQAEIWDYLRTCVRKYGVTPHIRFKSEVTEARYNENARAWNVRIRSGETIAARVLVSGMGGLSNPMIPDIPGLATFTGDIFHSAAWDASFDAAGKRIAVIGTGASAIQIVPAIAPEARQLTLFQRTPPWIIPRFDRPTTARERWLRRFLPGYAWLVRQSMYWLREVRALGFIRNTRILTLAQRIALRHLHAQVQSADLRDRLTPTYHMGCKRILLSDDYYPALERENVTLVTEPLREVRERTIVTRDGAEHEVDAIVLATGFRAQEFISPVQIYGRAGKSLENAWADGPRSYLGISASGFPNLFFLVGPNTGLGHNSMVIMIEAQIAYVMSALRSMRMRGITELDLKPEVESAFSETIARRTEGTVWASGCKSWYLDEHGRNTTLWPGFTFTYRRLTRRLEPACYNAL
ncbi:MAG: NAD(P)/FAD-dependent oxidoreductase [Candidatus Aquilonibacter sp.]|jgi:cation diffusion facilitator CzcD-associated flavoprotein CzcO